jgi:dipeptidyl aminopeptidase/acylaminoacyl peptidase
MVNCCITQYPDLFAAAVTSAGLSDVVSYYGGRANSLGPVWAEQYQGRYEKSLWADRRRYIESSPVFYLDRVKTPLMVLTGDHDIVVPPEQANEMFTGLSRLGKKAQLCVFRNEGHLVLDNPHYWEALYSWFDRWLKPQTSSAFAEMAPSTTNIGGR